MNSKNLQITATERLPKNTPPNDPIRKAALAVCASLTFVLPAQAQDQSVMKLTHVFPASHYLWEQGGRIFTNKVEEATNGRIKFEVYPAGQLGKDTYAAIRSGVADIAVLIPSYSGEKFPLTSVAELPGLYGNSCEGTARLWHLAKPGGMLSESEFKSLGLHILFVTVVPPNSVMTMNKPVPNLKALEGLKIRANGAAMDKTIRALGAVPVRVSSPELYDALSRGTVDGSFFTYQGLPLSNLQKLLKHSVGGPRLGGGSVLYGMTTKAWNALSDDQKAILTKASLSTQEALCKWQEAEDARVRELIVMQDGHVVAELPPTEVSHWDQRVSGVAAAWAQEMDAAGKNGTAILDAFKGAPATLDQVSSQ